MPISIGIPFYNAEMYLADAIRSVFAQTYQDWELILIDDGSSDRSLDIAHSIKDPRVRVFSDGLNKRLPHRLNQITAESRFSIIARMDADDLISPDRIEKQLTVLETNAEIDLVTTGVCSITNESQPVGIRCGSAGKKINGGNLMQGKCNIVHASLLARKTWFQRNPYDESAILTEDYQLWLSAFANNDFKLQIINEPLYYYREENNVTAHKLIKAYRNQVRLLNQYSASDFDRVVLISATNKFRVKVLIVKCLEYLGKTDMLLKNRNAHIESELDVKEFLSEIEKIRNTILPT